MLIYRPEAGLGRGWQVGCMPASGWLHRLAATRSQKILEATTLSSYAKFYSRSHDSRLWFNGATLSRRTSRRSMSIDPSDD